MLNAQCNTLQIGMALTLAFWLAGWLLAVSRLVVMGTSWACVTRSDGGEVTAILESEDAAERCPSVSRV